MTDPAHRYSAGTERALFSLAQRTCYFPGCPEPVIKFVEGHPATNVHIAHIHGAKAGSARFDSSMTDAERRAFTNLVLLCKPHHDLVDRISPADYPADVIQRWKAEREGGTTSDLSSVTDVTDARLAEVFEAVVQKLGPQRQVEVELGAGILVDNALARGPLGGWDVLVDLNPHLSTNPRVLVVTARNTGGMQVSVESITLYYEVATPAGAEIALMGENRYPLLNPDLPKLLDVGQACTWLSPRESFIWVRSRTEDLGNTIVALRAAAALGTGETIYSKRYSIEGLSL